MLKKLSALLLAFSLTFLWGCQLAVPEGAPESTEPDLLIGVYITTEYLDLLDAESWYAENFGKLDLSNSLTSGDMNEHRLLGEVSEDGLIFTGVTGMALAHIFTKPENTSDESGYWSTVADIGINHIHSTYNSTDNADDFEIKGNIYFSQDAGDMIFYFNPIYQTAAGQIYLVSGQGMHMSGALGGEMSQKTEMSSTMGPENDGSSYSAAFDVTVRSVEVPKLVTLIHMSSKHSVLSSESYSPNTMPTEITPTEGTAYILVETRFAESNSLTVIQPEGDPLETLIPLENGICDFTVTRILWPENE